MEKINQEKNEELWVVYEGNEGPGKGQHIVFVSGDEEYRLEEALPMLAKILAVHHGFKCTVLFAIDPETGIIDPINQTNIPGLHHLETADMMVLFTYGRQVLGETWINHHGHHGKESTRGVINEEMKAHPILKDIKDIWGPTDVYSVTELTGDAKVLVLGQVLVGMEPTDEQNLDKPTMPLAWIKTYIGEQGKTSRVFCTTMGASVDLESEGLRRLLVNACYWCMGMENQIPEKSKVDYVDEYNPNYFGFGDCKENVRPSDLRL